MTNDERFQDLERRLSETQAAYREAIDLMQFLGGSERVGFAAILAVIQAHPDKEKLRPTLLEAVDRAMSAMLFGSVSESHIQGAQDASKLILAALHEPPPPG